ncbi:ABC transporter substrate-binding protein [Gymnodinialimonas ceratoperidinii]|uniref:Extracellular solute-binding protein n=1 Tax=Gymnodinialimonas ceratoperidinii TaxID=2856823 RepID=A0A8F6YBK7_9RHOB|nr:extracellular solute-binding protein [Gymnodinialimonas ceratoperidinii]QXT40658.1 extracellular solute-binding protein [Gymnodinialimonas ceratoperidinii]
MRTVDLARDLARLCLAAFASLLMAQALAAQDFEIEDRRVYPGTGTAVLRILSTADLVVFEPFLARFQADNPEVGIDYVVASSAEVNRAIRGGAAFDLVLSSAMDLQFALANDGYARTRTSGATVALPGWAKWNDQLFAFTAESAVIVINDRAFEGLPLPRTRAELVTLLRDNSERFGGRLGTYDPSVSGLGYLFATQEARSSDAYWRLTEVMGRLGTQLYCCSGQMIDAVANGELALAYNVLGSYAAQRITRVEGVSILPLEDFVNVMLRTALIPVSATEVEAAGAMLDALLLEGMGQSTATPVLPPLQTRGDTDGSPFGPIRLGPALMVYLDRLNRESFLAEWDAAMEQ